MSAVFQLLFVLRLVLFTCLWGTSLLIWAGVGLYVWFAPSVPFFERFEAFQPKIGSRIYSVDHQLIGEFAAERRVLVPPQWIPALLAKAFMAAEDKRFFQHHGIDVIGVLNAFVGKLLHPREKLRGASTITQQVAKSLLVTHESYESATQRSLGRKVKEAILAYHLEQKLSKNQILYMYLTQIYLGNKAYGVGAAAQTYFNKTLAELSIAEMALLAGLPQRPSDYSPLHRPQAALARRRYVLRRMRDEHFITANEYEMAVAEKLEVAPRFDAYLQMAPSFTEQVRRELVERFGERVVLEEGLQVYTTLNLQWQTLAQQALMAGLFRLDKRQGYRGPVARLTPGEQQRLRGPLSKVCNRLSSDGIGLAVVTGFAADGSKLFVDVAGRSGVVPLPLLAWARSPNPLLKLDASTALRDVRHGFGMGDVLAVQRSDLAAVEAALQEPYVRINGSVSTYLHGLQNAQIYEVVQMPQAQGSLVVVDPASGEVRALVGGFDFDDSSFNRAMQACREPGSVFKPIVYASAIDKLNFTASTLVDDKPLVFDDFENSTRWKPGNASSQFRGRIPLRVCLKDSINTAAIRVANTVGMETVIDNARKLGLSTPLKRELGTALGSSCTTLWDLMQVYTTLHQYGRRTGLHMIRRVVDRFGTVLYDNSHYSDPTLDVYGRLEAAYQALVHPPEQVMSEQSAFLTVSLLKNVIVSGTARAAHALHQVAAGKTGTTNDAFDAWFIGFTRHVLAGVWVGHDKNERPLGPGEQGARTALPIWLELMQKLLLNYQTVPPAMLVEGEFPVPEGVAAVAIDGETGLLARQPGPRTVMEYYRIGTEPTELTPDRNVINPQEVDVYRADPTMDE